MALGRRPPFGVACEPVVDLTQAVLEHPTTFGVLRRAQVELAALRRNGRRALAEVELHQRPRLEQRLRLGGLGFECGDSHLERGDTLDVGRSLDVQRVLLGSDRRDLDVALRTLGSHARAGPFDTVELLHRASLRFRGRGFVGTAPVERFTCCDQRVGGRVARR